MRRERVYAIRRTDGEHVDDEYAFLIRGGPSDWPGDDLEQSVRYEGTPVEFELVEMKVRVLEKRTYGTDACPNHTEECGPHHSRECCYYDDEPETIQVGFKRFPWPRRGPISGGSDPRPADQA